MSEQHSELGASVAERWMQCPGSVRLSRGQPNPQTSYALEGKAAHALAERCLTTDTEPLAFLGTNFHGVEVTEEMVEAVDVYVTHVRSRMTDGADVVVEQQFDLAPLNPPGAMWGTADAVVRQKGWDHIDIIDFKYGRGVVVQAVGNAQLRYYALGAVLALGVAPSTVTMTIVQPRASHPDGIVRSETISCLDLIEFAADLLDAARKTLEPDAPLVPGEWCGFCRAAAVCPALHDHAMVVAQREFVDLDAGAELPDPSLLRKEDLLRVLRNSQMLENWLRSCSAYVSAQLAADPEYTDEFKLVAKRATRRWAVEDEQVIATLRDKGVTLDELFVRKLKSPAQIEKLVGKKQLPQALVSKVSSGVTLAPASDTRPEVIGAAEFVALPPTDDE